MSSGFVPGGTIDQPVERDDEWRKAQLELEETRRRNEEQSRQEEGKSLYEVLQANKAAKQDAFEESIRLKNQFRNLDEDEVEFLDAVLESTRAREEAVKKETREQLELFRRQQEEADRALMEESAGNGNADEVGVSKSPTGEESLWAVNAKKRKRLKEKEPNKFAKQRKQSLPLETPLPTNTKSPTHSTSATTNSISSAAPNEGHKYTPDSAGSPPSLAKEGNGTTNSASAEKPSDKLQGVNDKQRKPGLPNLGLGSYDTDDDE
ncbi:hypothetical protein MMC30_005588 [Trapelia coarctata]|nr:hypothetical protein [Trapelia coarctata]